MGKRGQMVYVPSVVIEEVDDIKREDNIMIRTEAYNKLIEYARVGRELNRMMKLDWSRKMKQPEFRENTMKIFKKNKKGGI